mmetsp:Transcript_28793/g.75856  ORF Transcript_28793/g.75856 Transcript_28793/m.75856 type:complete len:209 (+) Transcript_28793:79-705(+)
MNLATLSRITHRTELRYECCISTPQHEVEGHSCERASPNGLQRPAGGCGRLRRCRRHRGGHRRRHRHIGCRRGCRRGCRCGCRCRWRADEATTCSSTVLQVDDESSAVDVNPIAFDAENKPRVSLRIRGCVSGRGPRIFRGVVVLPTLICRGTARSARMHVRSATTAAAVGHICGESRYHPSTHHCGGTGVQDGCAIDARRADLSGRY